MEAEERLSERFSEAKRLEDDGDVVKSIAGYTDVINRCLSSIENNPTGESSDDKVLDLLAQAYNNRGYQKYRRVDFNGAIDDYTKCMERDRKMYVSFYNRGLIHYRLGRYHMAVMDMKDALNLQPDFEPAKKCLEQSLVDMERTKNIAK